jgi:drug/metabolite transporter (DMT)-like permease
MSIRGRATLGAVAVCVGLLMVVGGSVVKSTAVMKYERDIAHPKPNAAPPIPPSPTVPNMFMVLGWIFAAAGAVVVVFALRDLSRQIDDVQSKVEAQMQMEIAVKRDPKPKL